MLDAIIGGKLIKDPSAKTSANCNAYTNFLLSVSTGEAENIMVSGIAFGSAAERIGLLRKGDALAVTGSLKPSQWLDKATGQIRHGLSITVADMLSVYDISKKRRKSIENAPKTAQDDSQGDGQFYDDDIPI